MRGGLNLKKYPIDPEIVKKNAYLPVRLSELSKIDPDAAITILQEWGDGKKPITILWDDISSKLEHIS
jgi:hypothetical protein